MRECLAEARAAEGEPLAAAPDRASLGPPARGGSADMVAAAAYGSGFRQTTGATFRLVVDVGAWDGSVAMNSSGQSGDPAGARYGDLFAAGAVDAAFPPLCSRERVERRARVTITLRPSGGSRRLHPLADLLR
ncbi:penicillin acylase family protein [Streptomyces formicae]